MSTSIFCEQQLSGIASHSGTSPLFGAQNQRQINSTVASNIPGVSLSGNLINIPAYLPVIIEADTPAYMGENCRAMIWDFTNNVQLGIGKSQWSGTLGPQAEKENTSCTAIAFVCPSAQIQVGVMLYVGPTSTNPGTFGIPCNDGNPEIYTTVKVTTQ